ncbi:hypothetical protein [Spirochaeta isovalerica]|uniref:Uncharacterized protein n=1 Tax=Spirochaeta isovalerica TaxID=150 RepID=A0A841R654_9SPIO|nr:hypothetical protein [Spirochaeta isovalerica]MBB6478489.1 hypothetical protein [Spirochaeta isovalerica]
MSRIFNRILIALLAAAVTSVFLLPESYELPANDSEEEKQLENFLPEINEIPGTLSPGALSIHFPDERPAETTAKPEILQPEPVPEGPQFINSMLFVSSVVRNGERSWFFKDKSTGRMYDLSPGAENGLWEFLSDEGDYFLLKYNETIYKVRK